MADSDTIAPWGARSPGEPAPAEPAPPAPPGPRSRLANVAWGALSTLLLAAWVAWFAGPMGALALVGGVFVHEFGHMMVINWAGAGPSSLRIIPFFGGAATMRRLPDSDFKGVLIALAGPAFGLVAALPFVLADYVTGERDWLVGAFYVGVLNLVNLAPAAPLDGSKALGPVLARIHPWLERAVLLAIAALVLAWAISTGNLIFALVIVLGAVRAFLMTRHPRPSARPLDFGEWLIGLGLYLIVVAMCAAMTSWSVAETGLTSTLPFLGGAR